MLAWVLVAAVAAQVGNVDPERQRMVFFDWAKPELRTDDLAVLDEIAAEWRLNAKSYLLLSGHTDRSGSRAANRRAGLKRAQTVRDELSKRGIPGNAMRIISFGEDRPLIPTADGVREVQNRRVVIEFRE